MKWNVAILVLSLMVSACSPGGQSSEPSTTNTTETSSKEAQVTTTTAARITSTSIPSGSTVPDAGSTTTTRDVSPVTEGESLPVARPRSAIPWEDVDENWLLALYEGVEAEVLYLASPGADLFEIASWSPGSHPPHTLADWSPDGKRALIRRFNPMPIPSLELQLLDLRSGEVSVVESIPYEDETEPLRSLWGGFTRPTGLNLMVFKSVDGVVSLDRRTPSGTILTTFQAVGPWLYSPDGTELTIGDNNGLHLYRNDGEFVRDIGVARLAAVPLRWWSDQAILASTRRYGDPRSQGNASFDDMSLVVVEPSSDPIVIDSRFPALTSETFGGAWATDGRIVIEVGGVASEHSHYFSHTPAAPLSFDDGNTDHRILGTVDRDIVVLAFDRAEDHGMIARYNIESAPREPAYPVRVWVPRVGRAKGVVEGLFGDTLATRDSERWPLHRPGLTQPLAGEDMGGFEAYQPGWYPFRAGWFYQQAAGGASVSDQRAFTGTKSFRLSVDDNRAQVQGRRAYAAGTDLLTYRVAVNCSSEGSAGAEVGFSRKAQECPWSYCETVMGNSIRFDNDGSITLTGLESSEGGVVTASGISWSFDTWYVVEARIDFGTGIVSFWLDGEILATEVPAAPQEWSSVFALKKLAGNQGVVYFDDVLVSPGG